tara:strand:+ start:731 stop:1159 length:429 start_codon:yes stop_codon:yes gene_type:complete
MRFRSGCPLNVALEIVGDKWSLLIIRDLLNKKFSFSDFLNSNEAIAKNILSDRLKKLIKFKIINFKTPLNNKKVKLYFLTKKGLDLYPTMVELMLWSKKHSNKLVTSIKGKKVLNEIIRNGKGKYIEKRISNYKPIKEKEII